MLAQSVITTMTSFTHTSFVTRQWNYVYDRLNKFNERFFVLVADQPFLSNEAMDRQRRLSKPALHGKQRMGSQICELVHSRTSTL